MNIHKMISGSVVAGALVLSTVIPAFAATTVVVTPTDTQGWSTADTRPGGDVSFVSDATSPYPTGALQLTTDSTNAAKAQYMKAESLPLSSVTELSYYTKQVSGPAVAAASYQIAVDLNGDAAGGFTTLVYEPYWNGAVVNGTWQQWDVDAGQFWSSNTVAPLVVSGAGGPPFYSLAQLQAAYPDAVVLGFGVNVGTYNPNYVVEVDGVNFNGTTYNFEVTAPGPVVNEPTSKDACKKDGYKNFTDSEGNTFKNQGQCVSYFNHL